MIAKIVLLFFAAIGFGATLYGSNPPHEQSQDELRKKHALEQEQESEQLVKKSKQDSSIYANDKVKLEQIETKLIDLQQECDQQCKSINLLTADFDAIRDAVFKRLDGIIQPLKDVQPDQRVTSSPASHESTSNQAPSMSGEAQGAALRINPDNSASKVNSNKALSPITFAVPIPRAKLPIAPLIVASPKHQYAAPLWSVGPEKIDSTIYKKIFYRSPITSMSFSPDNKYILIGSGSGIVAYLYDVVNGKVVKEFRPGDAIKSVAIALNGKNALIGLTCGRMYLYDLLTGEVTKRLMHDSLLPVESIAVSNDSKYALTVSGKRVCLWDLESEIVKMLIGHTDSVTSVTFSFDSNYALTGSRDKTARFWDLKTGKTLLELKAHTDWINSVAISKTGKIALTGSRDKTTRLWNLKTGKIERVFEGNDSINAVAFSYVGKIGILTISANAKINVVFSREAIIDFKGQAAMLQPIAFSRDGRFIAIDSFEKCIVIYDLQNIIKESMRPKAAKPLVVNNEGAFKKISCPAQIQGLCFSHNNKLIASAEGKKVCVRDIYSGAIKILNSGGTYMIGALAISADGKWVLGGSDPGQLLLWDVDICKIVKILRGYTARITSIVFSPDSRQALTASVDESICLWDLTTGKIIRMLSNYANVCSLAMSPDGKYALSVSTVNYALSGSTKGMVRYWNLNTGEIIRELEEDVPFVNYINSVSFSADGKFALTASDSYHGCPVSLWDLSTGKIIKRTSCKFPVKISANGRYAFTKNFPDLTTIYDLTMGEPVIVIKDNSNSFVKQAAISSDGKFLALARDKVIIIFDLYDLLEKKTTVPTINSNQVPLAQVATMTLSHALINDSQEQLLPSNTDKQVVTESSELKNISNDSIAVEIKNDDAILSEIAHNIENELESAEQLAVLATNRTTQSEEKKMLVEPPSPCDDGCSLVIDEASESTSSSSNESSTLINNTPINPQFAKEILLKYQQDKDPEFKKETSQS